MSKRLGLAKKTIKKNLGVARGYARICPAELQALASIPLEPPGLQERVCFSPELSQGMGMPHRCNLPMTTRALSVSLEDVHLSLLPAGQSVY